MKIFRKHQNQFSLNFLSTNIYICIYWKINTRNFRRKYLCSIYTDEKPNYFYFLFNNVIIFSPLQRHHIAQQLHLYNFLYNKYILVHSSYFGKSDVVENMFQGLKFEFNVKIYQFGFNFLEFFISSTMRHIYI